MQLKKKKGSSEPGLPSWIVSYGDLVTTLLCFFIILSALAEDQTGVKLCIGLNSFRNRPLLADISGMHNRTRKTVPLKAPGPSVIPKSQDGNKNGSGGGDPDEPEARNLDAELEQFQWYLKEMERNFDLGKLPKVEGQTIVDVHEPLQKDPIRPGVNGQKTLLQMINVLARGDYRVTVIVWATMPSASAWKRATTQSQAITSQAANLLRLSGEARDQLHTQGRIWQHSERRRPVFSVVVAKLQ